MTEIFYIHYYCNFFINLMENFVRSLIAYQSRPSKICCILSKCDCGETLLLSLATAKVGRLRKDSVSTANEGGLTSEAAFLFASVPRFSFHGSFSQEPHAECLEDTRRWIQNVCSFLFFFLTLSAPAWWKKKDNPFGCENVTLRIPAVHPWKKSQRPSRF